MKFCKKSIKSIYSLAVIHFITVTILFSQSAVDISIVAEKDSTESIFAQDIVRIKFTISGSDTLYFAHDESSRVEFRFPGKDWMSAPFPLSDSESDNILKSGTFKEYANVLPVFVNDSTLINSVNQSFVPLEIRYCIHAGINDPFQYYYSNIDTIILTGPSQDDFLALAYLRSSGIDPLYFSWLHQLEEDKKEYYEYLKNNNKLSIISDMADYILLEKIGRAHV